MSQTGDSTLTTRITEKLTFEKETLKRIAGLPGLETLAPARVPMWNLARPPQHARFGNNPAEVVN